MKELVLASASPRRTELLSQLGVAFTVCRSMFHEPVYRSGQSPAAYVRRNALGKAGRVAGRFSNALVVGADTIVVCNRRVLGKPRSYRQARTYLRVLSGTTHEVYTGVALVDTDEESAAADYAKTLVRFRDLTDDEIEAYLARIEPLDKAGAYAIQGQGSLIVASIRGCYYNVVGFPVAKLEQMLLKKGISLFDYMQEA